MTRLRGLSCFLVLVSSISYVTAGRQMLQLDGGALVLDWPATQGAGAAGTKNHAGASAVHRRQAQAAPTPSGWLTASCPTTTDQAFVNPANGPTTLNQTFTTGQSCAQFASIKLNVQDLFSNVLDGSRMTIDYFYYGKFVQLNQVTCDAFGSGAPSVADSSNALYTFLGTTIGKPYPPNWLAQFGSQICAKPLGSFFACNATWNLDSSRLLSYSSAESKAACCDGNDSCVVEELPAFYNSSVTTNPVNVWPSPPPSPPSGDSGGSSSNVGAIVGGVVGGVLGAALIAVAVWWFGFHKRRASKEGMYKDPLGGAMGSTSDGSAAAHIQMMKGGKSVTNTTTTTTSMFSTLQALPEDGAADAALHQQADDARRAAAMSTLAVADHLRIAYADVEFENGKEIGQGGFSVVYCCSWQGHRVVLKVVRPELASERQRAILVREALLMRELQHPAVARVYGVIDEAPHHALVMQYYKRGTLEDFMCNKETADDYDSLSVLDRLRLAGQVADGMAYLHARSPPIVHGDLKPSNLLVDEDNKVVITDFGLAVQLMSGGSAVASTPKGAYPSTLKAVLGNAPMPSYAASSPSASLFSTLWTSPTSALSIFISPPEVLAAPQAPRQPAADVFAFGVSLWQIMAGRIPYRGMSADMVIFAVCQGKRPAIPDTDEVPVGVAAIIEDCWAQVAEKRPTFAQVAARLKAEIQLLKESDA